jgi:hypothetical protein
MSTTDSAFDDADQLGQYLQDTKGSDKKRMSTIAAARAVVQQFRGNTAAGAWPSLDRETVAMRLLELLGPDEASQSDAIDTAGAAIQQGAMNLCGPAAALHALIKRDPLSFANYATQLFDSGAGTIGAWQVVPDASIVNANYAAYLPSMGFAVCPQADWMILGALRNSTNAFLTGSFEGDPAQTLSAATTPAALTDWLTRTGIYATVRNEANWMQPAGIPHAQGLPLNEGVDVIPLINANLINYARNLPSDTSWPLTEFPDHWVVLIGEVMQDVTKDAVFFNIWTWGEQQILEVPTAAFVDNYYGAVIATLRS